MTEKEKRDSKHKGHRTNGGTAKELEGNEGQLKSYEDKSDS